MNTTHTHAEPGKRRATKPEETLDTLAALLKVASAEYKAARRDALDYSLEIGRVGLRAKHHFRSSPAFHDWLCLQTGMSTQWLRKCMHAALAFEYAKDRNDFDELREKVTSVEHWAKIKTRLRDGVPDPLADHIPGIAGRPTGLGVGSELRRMYDQIGDLHRLIRQGATYATAWKQLQYIAKHAPKPTKE